MEFEVVLDVRARWLYFKWCKPDSRSWKECTYVDVQSSKILPELLLLLRSDVLEILAAEDDHSALSDQQSQLVLLSIAERA